MMAHLPEAFKKKPGPKFVQNMVRNNNTKKSGQAVPASQKQRPGVK